MEPKAAEVVPQAIIKEAPVVRTASRAHSEMVGNIRKTLEESGFEASLKIVQSPPIEQRKISQKLEQFGIKRNATTGAKELTTEEQARRDDAEKGANFAKKFIEVGYDNMDPVGSGEQDQLRDILLDSATIRPEFEKVIQGMNDVQKKALLERWLKDPRLSKEVRTSLNKLLDPEKKLIDIVTHQDAKETAALDLEDVKAEKIDHARIWEGNDRQLKEYEVRPATSPGQPADEGTKWQRLQGLTNEIQTARNDFNTANIDLVNVQTEIKKLRNDLVLAQRLVGISASPPRPVSTIETDLRNAATKEVSFRERVSQLDGELKAKEGEAKNIDAEHQALITRRKELDTEKRAIEKKVKVAERNLNKKQFELQDAMIAREGEEQDLADGINSIFSEAADNFLNSEVAKAQELVKAELVALKEKTTDNNEKALLDGIERDMLVDAPIIRKKGILGFRTKEETRPMSKNKVYAYHDTLMKNGPLEPAVKLLISQDNPAAGVIGVKYTDAEARAILANKTFADKMLPIVTEQILARKMLVGGISQEDIHIVVNSQWGKDMLDKARDKNKVYFNAVEKDMGPGAFDAPNFHEKLAEKIRKHPWWLYLILGIPFLAGGAMASKSLENIGK